MQVVDSSHRTFLSQEKKEGNRHSWREEEFSKSSHHFVRGVHRPIHDYNLQDESSVLPGFSCAWRAWRCDHNHNHNHNLAGPHARLKCRKPVLTSCALLLEGKATCLSEVPSIMQTPLPPLRLDGWRVFQKAVCEY